MSWLIQNNTTLSRLSHTAEIIRGKKSLTVTTALPVEQTGIAVIPPFHVSVAGHPPSSTFAAQQGVHQDLQAQTSTPSVWVAISRSLFCLLETERTWTQATSEAACWGGRSSKSSCPPPSNVWLPR